MADADLERDFPKLASASYRVTSPSTPEYNCIAWAAHVTDRPWWPTPLRPYHWPVDVPDVATVESFVDAFKELGFQICDDGELENGFEKLAIYADKRGEPTHMARQLASGAWTSKLGSSQDIEHGALEGLEGGLYGSVVRFLRRERV